MRGMIGVVVCIAALSAAPALATTDSLVSVIVPVQHPQAEGYCRWEMLAADGITTFGTAPTIVGEVLSRPIYTFALGNYRPDGTRDPQIDINPISGDPPIAITIDAGDKQDMRSPLVNISIGPIPTDAAQLDMTLTRAKLALLFALKNIFAINRCAKVTATIKGLPEQDRSKVRLFERTQYPHTVTSPHYLALIKELTADAPCMAGRPLTDPLPIRATLGDGPGSNTGRRC